MLNIQGGLIMLIQIGPNELSHGIFAAIDTEMSLTENVRLKIEHEHQGLMIILAIRQK